MQRQMTHPGVVKINKSGRPARVYRSDWRNNHFSAKCVNSLFISLPVIFVGYLLTSSREIDVVK